MDINIYNFPCIGCKYATVGGMKIYCMQKGRNLTHNEHLNLTECDLKETFDFFEDEDEHLSYKFEVI